MTSSALLELANHGDGFDLDALRGDCDDLRLDAIEQLAVDDFAWFVRCTWRIVEGGTPLRWSWHLDTLCRELGDVLIQGGDLVIAIPPGYGKSLLTSVFLPAWAWLRDPADRMIYVSGSESIAKRDSNRTRQIVRSRFYRRLVERRILALRSAVERGEDVDLGSYARLLAAAKPRAWELDRGQAEKVNFTTELGGVRMALTIRAHVTGERGRVLVVDDPVDAKDVVLQPAERQAELMADTVRVFDQVLRSRLSPFRRVRIVIAQRLHPDDLPGVLLRRKGKRRWRRVVIDERFNPDRLDVHPDDPRTEPGELAAPTVYGADEADERAAALGARHAAAQLGQEPSPTTGGMFDAALEAVDWYFDNPHEVAHRDGYRGALSVDATFGGKGVTASNVAIQAWTSHRAHLWILSSIARRMGWRETRDAVIQERKIWRKSRRVIIERKANGAALLEDLADDVAGLEPFDPDASKEGRASILVNRMERGQVHAPHPDNPWIPKVRVPFAEVAPLIPDGERRGERWPAEVVELADGSCEVPWVVLWRAELAAFPGGRRDDQVDASSCAAIKLGEDGGENAKDRIERQLRVLSQGPGADVKRAIFGPRR